MSLKDCPKCGKTNSTHVLDSRANEDYTRRRLSCKECKERFSTREYREEFFTEFDRAKKIERFEETLREIFNAYIKNLSPEDKDKFLEEIMTI